MLNQSFDIKLTHMHATTHIKFVTQHTHPTCLGIHWICFKTRRTLQQKVWETALYGMITILIKSQLILYMYNLKVSIGNWWCDHQVVDVEFSAVPPAPQSLPMYVINLLMFIYQGFSDIAKAYSLFQLKKQGLIPQQ